MRKLRSRRKLKSVMLLEKRKLRRMRSRQRRNLGRRWRQRRRQRRSIRRRLGSERGPRRRLQRMRRFKDCREGERWKTPNQEETRRATPTATSQTPLRRRRTTPKSPRRHGKSQAHLTTPQPRHSGRRPCVSWSLIMTFLFGANGTDGWQDRSIEV